MSDVFGLGAFWLMIFAVLGAIGLWLLVTGLRNLLRGRLIRGPARGALGVAIGGLALGGAGLGMNLHTYDAFNHDVPVASVRFQQVGPQQFEAHIRTNGGEQLLVVHGDEWQLDVRVLKWEGLGVLLGLKPVYRLERFGGRYSRLDDEQRAQRSVYGLTGSEPGINAWHVAQRVERWLPLVDTVYGSATYLPMADGAEFNINITEDSLVARAANAKAASAVRRW